MKNYSICLLQRAGAVFPKRSEQSAPVFTPPQTQPLSSYPQNLRNQEARPDAAESSADSEFPTLTYIFSPSFESVPLFESWLHGLSC